MHTQGNNVKIVYICSPSFMKRIAHTLCHILLLCFIANGQDKSNQEKKVTKEYEEYDLKNYKSEPSDRLILEVSHTGWLNVPKGITMNWKSMGFNVALMFDKSIGRSNFSVGYGIGFFNHNFHSNADFVYRYDSLQKHNITDIIPKTNNYTVNRFSQRIVEVPLEIRFRTKTISKFKIMLGGKIGYVFSDFRKVFDDKGHFKFYDTKNMNYLRYGVVARIGVEQFCLTASYYFSEVFTKRGPDGIIPYSVGIAIIPF
jgi:hypothetical protein